MTDLTPRPEAIDMESLEASFIDTSLGEGPAAPVCPFLPVEGIFEDGHVLSKLTLLKNLGVQMSSFQNELRAAAEKRLDATHVKAANDFFVKNQFISSTDYPGKSDAHYYSLCSNSLTLLFNSNSIAGVDATEIRRWFSDCNLAFHDIVPNFKCHCIGQKRIGGQVDVRPDPIRVAQLSDIATARNKDQKIEMSQRQKEKAAKEKAALKNSATSSNNSAAAAAAPAVAAVVREKPVSPDAARAALWERLKAMGVTLYKEKNPDLSVKKPVGHSTHNLWVKDKKKKKHFLLMARQNAQINLKNVTKAIGMKQLRLSRDAGSILCTDSGCITCLSLMHDTENKGTLVRDASLSKLTSLRICAGCSDARDHSQHNVVDITPAQLDILLHESGHFDGIVDLQFPDAVQE